MTGYPAFDFYADVYGGKKIQEKEWPYKADQAIRMISYITGRSVSWLRKFMFTDPESDALDLSLCLCAVADKLQEQESQTSGIQSESTDGYSVSYASKTEAQSRQEIADICSLYLDSSGLMYIGFSL